MAEGRNYLTPYNYVQNNPILRIDPEGLTDFTFDSKTGGVTQVGEANDEPDRILKTYKRGKKKGQIKYKKNGEAKVAIGGIAQGILQDGMNLKENSTLVEVGGEGQPSESDVESFALKLSEHVRREIGGSYFSLGGGDNPTHMTLGSYGNNSYKATKNSGLTALNPLIISSGKDLQSGILGFFHTHPKDSSIKDSDRLVPSGQDRDRRDDSLKLNPDLKFYLITKGTGSEHQRIPYHKGYPRSGRP